jgi:ribose/xylose/arabinose/galactoside ABC-type transport system permease subunit
MTVIAPPIAPEAPRPRPGRGLVAHLGWEAILLFLVVVAAIVAVASSPANFGIFRQNFWLNLAVTGLLASAFAVSVRTRTVNLAVAAQAVLAGIVYARLVAADWPALIAGVIAVIAIVVLGLILALVSGLTGVPGWAVSLAGIGIAEGISIGLAEARGVVIPGAMLSPAWSTAIWVALFVLGSLAGAAAFFVAGTDVPRDGVASRMLRSFAGFGLSSVLAGISGVVFVSHVAFATAGGDSGRLLTAAGAVLLGGVSAVSGRGGIAGTVLATLLLVVINIAMLVAGIGGWISYVPAAIAILVGVVVGSVFDRLSAPAGD